VRLRDPDHIAGPRLAGFRRAADWAGDSGRGIQLEAMLPGALAVYAQFHGEPDIGAGILASYNPGLYAMIGNSWLEADGRGYHLAGGLKANVLPGSTGADMSPVPNGAAFASASYQSGDWRVGLMAEHVEFSRTWTFCDENCEPENYLRRISSAGLFATRSWR
jgi:hypothetical protein